MPTTEARLGAWSLNAPAGTTVQVVQTWTDANDDPVDLSAGLSIWVGGTDRDLDDFTGATEYEAAISGGDDNVATVSIPVPAGSTHRLLRTVLDGVTKTVGKLRPVQRGGESDLAVEVQTVESVAVTVEVLGTVTSGGGGGAPSGPAGGVLSGTYPDPGFAVDMATQAELNTEATTRANADTALDGRLDTIEAISIATDAELAAAVAAESALARNADNLTSGTVADARIASTIARDSEVAAAIAASEATAAGTFAPLVVTVETVTGTTYSVQASDTSKVKRFTNASLCTVTLPAGIAVGTIVELRAAGAAGIAVQDDGTSTVDNEGAVAQGDSVSCLVEATNTWSVVGPVS